MEDNRLTHNMPTKEPKNKLADNTQACRSPNTKGTETDDKALAPEEGHSDDSGKVVEAEAPTDHEAGRERLKRHREEMVGRVNIPENWGHEQLMKDWIDYTTFDALFAPHRLIVAARDALIADGRKARSQRLRIQSSC